jgi:hypothetical protein
MISPMWRPAATCPTKPAMACDKLQLLLSGRAQISVSEKRKKNRFAFLNAIRWVTRVSG